MNPARFILSRGARRAVLTLTVACLLAATAGAQTLDRFERERAQAMLRNIRDDIKKHYYDPNFHGIDVDARFSLADDKIKEATSIGQAFGIIAQTLLDFDDSHLYFIPPGRAASVDYGWKLQMIGDECFVVAVKPGSDAEAKGLKVGDKVLTLGGFQPTRAILWKMMYAYNVLRPQMSARFVVESPGGGAPRQLDVAAKIKQGKRVLNLTGTDGGADIHDLIRRGEDEDRLNRHRLRESAGVLIWKMPQFDLLEAQVDDIMDKAKGKDALILDLRGNGGGAEVTMLRLLGHFFDREVKVGDLKLRKEQKPVVAKSRGKNAFAGKVLVLVDSGSGSASEVLARVVQLEKRGTIIGDRTAGAVMRSRRHEGKLGTETVIFYGASITNADLVMTDGKSLEHAGVTPDVVVLPRAADMAAGRDPVLARAASLVGVSLSPEAAGAMFPVEWKR